MNRIEAYCKILEGKNITRFDYYPFISFIQDEKGNISFTYNYHGGTDPLVSAMCREEGYKLIEKKQF